MAFADHLRNAMAQHQQQNANPFAAMDGLPEAAQQQIAAIMAPYIQQQNAQNGGNVAQQQGQPPQTAQQTTPPNQTPQNGFMAQQQQQPMPMPGNQQAPAQTPPPVFIVGTTTAGAPAGAGGYTGPQGNQTDWGRMTMVEKMQAMAPGAQSQAQASDNLNHVANTLAGRNSV